MRKEISIKNEVGELARVASFVEEIGEELGLDMELQMNLNLVMEEMVSNVIFYAYPKETSADIELVAESDGKELTFVLSDQGKEFDPTLKDDADPNVNPIDREIGGMGIYIVKNIMNQVTYQRLEGKNLLTMKKSMADIAAAAGIDVNDDDIQLINTARFVKLSRLKQLGIYEDGKAEVKGPLCGHSCPRYFRLCVLWCDRRIKQLCGESDTGDALALLCFKSRRRHLQRYM